MVAIPFAVSNSLRAALLRGVRLCAPLAVVLALRGSAGAQSLFEFVQISDSQPQTSAENQRLVDVLRTIAEAGQPGALLPRSVDLVLFAGDITWGNSQSEWIAAKAKLDDWLTDKGIPYRAVPGNHDVNGSDTSRYQQYIGSAGVWDIGSASFSGHNGITRTTGWKGLRFIGFNNSNPDYNQIASADLSSIQARVNAAAAANENAFLLCHHPHDGSGRMPLANVLPNPSIVGYLHGHSGTPRVKKGLTGIHNPNVWDVDTNAIVLDRDLVYFEVFPTELRAYVVILDDNPIALGAPVVIPLVHPLSTGVPVPVADFSATPRTGTAPLSVNFTDRSTNSPTSWLWDFGDGTSSTARNPVHVYARSGSYTVKLDAGNASGVGVRTRTGYIVVAVSSTRTFLPVADVTAKEDKANKNQGSTPTLQVKVQRGKSLQTFLKFDLSSLSGNVTSAKLRIYCTDASADAGRLYGLTNSSWTESGLTWNNRPSLPGGSITTLGSVSKNSWKELDVTSVVRSAGVFAFAIANGSSDMSSYSSRQGSSPPQLVVTTGRWSMPSPPDDLFDTTASDEVENHQLEPKTPRALEEEAGS